MNLYRPGLKAILLLAVALFLLVPPVIDLVNGRVKSETGCHIMLVMDGDTLKMNCPDQGRVTARIIGYDAPEKNARCIGEFFKAIRATWALRMVLWQGHRIKIGLDGNDRYGRYLVRLHVDGKDIVPGMINAGVVRAYSGGRRGSWCDSRGPDPMS